MDESIQVKRSSISENWGISMSYTKRWFHLYSREIIVSIYSANSGLLLVLAQVSKGSPAWLSGLRGGEAIATVNQWNTFLMERPEVEIEIIRHSD